MYINLMYWKLSIEKNCFKKVTGIWNLIYMAGNLTKAKMTCMEVWGDVDASRNHKISEPLKVFAMWQKKNLSLMIIFCNDHSYSSFHMRSYFKLMLSILKHGFILCY